MQTVVATCLVAFAIILSACVAQPPHNWGGAEDFSDYKGKSKLLLRSTNWELREGRISPPGVAPGMNVLYVRSRNEESGKTESRRIDYFAQLPEEIRRVNTSKQALLLSSILLNSSNGLSQSNSLSPLSAASAKRFTGTIELIEAMLFSDEIEGELPAGKFPAAEAVSAILECYPKRVKKVDGHFHVFTPVAVHDGTQHVAALGVAVMVFGPNAEFDFVLETFDRDEVRLGSDVDLE